LLLPPQATTTAESIEAPPEWLDLPAVGGFKVWQVVTGGSAAFAMIGIIEIV
jgi:hypothetical protein